MLDLLVFLLISFCFVFLYCLNNFVVIIKLWGILRYIFPAKNTHIYRLNVYSVFNLAT